MSWVIYMNIFYIIKTAKDIYGLQCIFLKLTTYKVTRLCLIMRYTRVPHDISIRDFDYFCSSNEYTFSIAIDMCSNHRFSNISLLFFSVEDDSWVVIMKVILWRVHKCCAEYIYLNIFTVRANNFLFVTIKYLF